MNNPYKTTQQAQSFDSDDDEIIATMVIPPKAMKGK
jgi:hypothetical protein